MPADVIAEIVATVREVRVTEGTHVDVGDTLILLEAMKMQIPLRATEAGTIGAINVRPGDDIRAGDVLAVYR